MSRILEWSVLVVGVLLLAKAAYSREGRAEASTTATASTAPDPEERTTDEPPLESDPASAEPSAAAEERPGGGEGGPGITRTLQGPRDLQRRIYTQINFRSRNDDDAGDAPSRKTRNDSDGGDGDEDDVRNGETSGRTSSVSTGGTRVKPPTPTSSSSSPVGNRGR